MSPSVASHLRRRGGCALTFIDPLGWRAHGSAWPFVWFARKWRIGARPNVWGHAMADRVRNRRMRRWYRAASKRARAPSHHTR